MKVSTVILGVLAACAVAYSQQVANHGPVVMALQRPLYQQPELRQVAVVEQPTRQKRSLLLGALGAGAIGAGVLGAAALGAGALGAGALGAGALVGAKAGFVGGAIASRAFSGRSYGGGYGYGGYGYGGGYGGYVDYEPVYYGGYRSYPSYYTEDDWC